MYICQSCRKAFSSRDIQVDHIDPVVPIGEKAFDMSLDVIASRLWCDKDNLQVLCKPCHKKKSADEVGLRRKAKRKNAKNT